MSQPCITLILFQNKKKPINKYHLSNNLEMVTIYYLTGPYLTFLKISSDIDVYIMWGFGKALHVCIPKISIKNAFMFDIMYSRIYFPFFRELCTLTVPLFSENIRLKENLCPTF